ncbi:LytTR family DNA-binding domain-containing protein [Clostridium estertheticum]|uniref:LytR/AlgR family response regulator transcription factor n=1 Tax=Clostridium estertheticum TaxID=238834 RepID=UPI001C7DA99F|nr:LytTR family DNA-binding domain-containing protein [Clostridium estertheticum]MBX4262824.1 LytTR family DNA-binding domain-containing protein [Clostridium estertheticum]WLC70880.1 LytTR family DNA-binding domain-containing protein [Clostridium estertheticum]
MKIAVCDDESVFTNQISSYLEKYYHSLDVLIETFQSGEEFLKRFIVHPDHYDLIFLDIEMGGIDGVSTARQIRKCNRQVLIIFLTSHLEFAVDGYEVDAFRFLPKPIQEVKLLRTLTDIQTELDRNKKLLISKGDREILLRYQDIVFLKAQNINVLIRTKQDSYVIRKTLNALENEIEGPVFFSPHRSYVINLSYVADYDKKAITMETGERIALSRNKVSEFRTAMMTYVRICGK